MVRLQISTGGPDHWAWLCWAHGQKASACWLCLERPCCPAQITTSTTLLLEHLALLPSILSTCSLVHLCPSVSSSRSQAPQRQRPSLHSWFLAWIGCLEKERPPPVLTDQQLGEVRGLNVMIVDHRGDGSHECHPSWHVQVEVAGFCHPVMGEEREEMREGMWIWPAHSRATQVLCLLFNT